MFPVKNTNHVGVGLSRLTQRFRTPGGPRLVGSTWLATNVELIARSYLLEVQAAENATWDVLTLRNIASGVGDQLDQIGKLVGQGRAGLLDAAYRVAIGLRVLANRSKGRTIDILKIAQTLATTFTTDMNGIVEYAEGPIMAFSVGVWNQTAPALAASLLSEARAAGSRGVMVYSTWPFPQNLVPSISSDLSAGQGKVDYSTGGVTGAGLLAATWSL